MREAAPARSSSFRAKPGLEKSRLTVALQDRLRGEPNIQLQYFCSPHHSNTALYPLISQLERDAGIGRDDAPSDKLKKLRALLAGNAAPCDEIDRFAELLSPPAYDGRESAEARSEQSKERSLLAFRRQIEGPAADQPVLLIFEDAHWGDPTSIEFLNLAIERIREFPVLLIVTFRPEFRPQWSSESHVTVLTLNRLDAGDTADFVGASQAEKCCHRQSSIKLCDVPMGCRSSSRSSHGPS